MGTKTVTRKYLNKTLAYDMGGGGRGLKRMSLDRSTLFLPFSRLVESQFSFFSFCFFTHEQLHLMIYIIAQSLPRTGRTRSGN